LEDREHGAGKIPLAGSTAGEIAALLADGSGPDNSGLPQPFRARQIFDAIQNGASDFEEITVLPLEARKRLAERFTLRATKVSASLPDTAHRTVKLRIALPDGLFIEAVLLRDGKGRQTACLSAQAGCPLACAFCATGALGFSRNLSPSEITEQYHHLAALNPGTPISNIVFMGMGEPLLNPGALERAINIFAFSQRRITISTAGIVSGIYGLCERKTGARLAVSMTTADPVLREKLMPVTRANPLPALKEALLFYQGKKKKRITLEAVLLKGINTRQEDIRALKKFAEGLNTLVNLIPFNPAAKTAPAGPFYAPDIKEILKFKTALEKSGLKTVLRRSLGRSVNGACGQLGAAGLR